MMDSLIQWGLLLIESVQEVQSPLLNRFFQLVTSLGDEIFYLIFFPFLLWCVNFQLGIRVGILFLLSVYFNSLLKILFQQPRPFDLFSTVQLSYAEGFGFPSGHAQSSILVWGSIAYWSHRKVIWLIAFFLSFLIGFSRIYLGVHFPHDVVGGWLAGGFLFYFYHFIIMSRVKVLKKLTMDVKKKIFYISLLPIIIIVFPAADAMISVIAALTGVGWGLVINAHFIYFQGAYGSFWQRINRFLIGVLGIISLYFGLKIIFPQAGQCAYQFFRFIRYAILGLWIGAGAPWIFLKLKLVGRDE
jgi:membrane-associated phospholipid phosphatase